MTGSLAALAEPRVVPPLDPTFRPSALADRAFAQLAAEGPSEPLAIRVERNHGAASTFRTRILAQRHPKAELNVPYVERLVKFLLWQKGGWKVTLSGSPELAQALSATYSPTGARAFDAEIIGRRMFERPMLVEFAPHDQIADSQETSMPVGRHLEGYRVGFDLGASDRKAAAVVDGEAIWTDEVVWSPRDHADPGYHYAEIRACIESAAAKMPRLDAIGGSSAGCIIDNRVMVASLFRGVPEAAFDSQVKDIFLRLGQEFGVPIEVANDGDVTALAGAMSLESNCVLGVAMGSSEAAGYVDAQGNITGWLNELAFAPIDISPTAHVDEWSGEPGVGAQYLTQQAVFRMGPALGIDLDGYGTLAEKLKAVQELLESGDERARLIWETIGVYTGYAVAHYASFYPIENMLILGRVTSGSGGAIILERAKDVLLREFPDLKSMTIMLPDEKTRRVGQAVAAASLPAIPKERP